MKNKSILVIDDEKVLNDAYVHVLKSAGFEAWGVLTAQEGLDALIQNSPAAILLDLNMPDISGISFLEKAELAINHPDTKVIVFSTVEDNEMIQSAYKLGANKYVLKQMLSPFDLETIVNEELGVS